MATHPVEIYPKWYPNIFTEYTCYISLTSTELLWWDVAQIPRQAAGPSQTTNGSSSYSM